MKKTDFKGILEQHGIVLKKIKFKEEYHALLGEKGNTAMVFTAEQIKKMDEDEAMHFVNTILEKK